MLGWTDDDEARLSLRFEQRGACTEYVWESLRSAGAGGVIIRLDIFSLITALQPTAEVMIA